MKQKRIIIIPLILIGAVFWWLSCSDNPTAPDSGNAEYRLFALDYWGDCLLSFAVPADTIIDSVRLDYYAWGVFVTPDGSRLLINNYITLQTEVHSATDLSHIESRYQYGDYYFDGRDDYGLLYSYIDNALHFIDPQTLAITSSIPRQTPNGYLDTVNNIFYGASEYSGGYTDILVIDCLSQTIIDSLAVNAYLYEFLYSPRDNSIYFHSRAAVGLSLFCRYDITGDSITVITRTADSFGSLALTPDQNGIIMTDGGNGMIGIVPDGNIWVIEVGSNDIIKLIPPFIYPNGPKFGGICLGTIRIIPEISRTYIGSNVNAGSGRSLLVVDNTSYECVNYISPYRGFYVPYLAVAKINND